MSTLHTRGPWRADIRASRWICIADADGNRIAEVEAPPFTRPRREHDARLIAAAPELLEALRRMVSITWGSEAATTSDGCYTNDPNERMARAAILKATGEAA